MPDWLYAKRGWYSPRHAANSSHVVGFAAVAEDVRIGVGGDAQLPLADEAADLRQRPPLPVQEADPPVTEVVG